MGLGFLSPSPVLHLTLSSSARIIDILLLASTTDPVCCSVLDLSRPRRMPFWRFCCGNDEAVSGRRKRSTKLGKNPSLLAVLLFVPSPSELGRGYCILKQ